MTAARNINIAFGSGTCSERTTQHWFKRFRSGVTTLEDRKGRGMASKLDDNFLKSLVEENPRTTVSELASQLGVDKSTVSRHLITIGKTKSLISGFLTI